MIEAVEADRRNRIELVTRQLDWYHSIELYPGFFTPGHAFTNIVATRAILSRCEIERMACLDIGTMDGLIAAILSRRKAGYVLACDRYDRHVQIDLVRRALGLNFQYLPNATLADVRARSPKLHGEPFDLVVFSGVLYHMYDPMNGLAIVRSLVREGGIVVIETTAAVSDLHVGYFNAYGRNQKDPHDYWTVSVTLLDYLLRYFRLKPLDCAFFENGSPTEDGSPGVRVAIPCLAVAEQLHDESDGWMVANRDDYAGYQDWTSPNKRPVGYEGLVCDRPVWHPSGGLDLKRSIVQSSPVALRDDLRRLPLGMSR